MTNPGGAAIEVVDLAKAYGEPKNLVRAVDGVTFSVGEGEFFGILGPNGAGKTTTLEMIEGLRRPDAGTITLLGQSPWPRDPAVLPRIGVQAAVADEWLERVGLVDKADTRVWDLTPHWLQNLAPVLPLFWLNNGMLDVMVRGEPAIAVLLPMTVLAGFAAVVTLLAAKLFRWETT